MLDRALKQIESFPPLVFAGEARSLQASLAAVCAGEAFLLQAGDCAESFEEFSADNIREKLRVILQMAVVLTYSMGVPVVKVGRMAGQFAKPRSSDTERIGDDDMLSFRGHMVNDAAPNQIARVPNPDRLVQAYHQSASTLNLLRAFTKGGFADLARVHSWNQEFVSSSPEGRRYERVAAEIDRAMRFMRAAGIDTTANPNLSTVDVFTSHEALLLNYEQALTRFDAATERWWALSGHMIWIGDRTRALDGSHVDFARGVANPVGLKCGPTMQADELLRLIDRLDPANERGRLVLIARFGAGQVHAHLPALMRATREAGRRVIWSVDPMHGNTRTVGALKTRLLKDIVAEIDGFFDVAAAQGVHPGGVHLEMTGADVTECLGGSRPLVEADLPDRYLTHCDPRLNGRQALDVAGEVARLLARDPHAAEHVPARRMSAA